jgi:hypothetical protein
MADAVSHVVTLVFRVTVDKASDVGADVADDLLNDGVKAGAILRTRIYVSRGALLSKSQ